MIVLFLFSIRYYEKSISLGGNSVMKFCFFLVRFDFLSSMARSKSGRAFFLYVYGDLFSDTLVI